MTTDELKAKFYEADARASRWLAEGNAASEAGKAAKAERRFDKAQYWTDRRNQIQECIWEQGGETLA